MDDGGKTNQMRLISLFAAWLLFAPFSASCVQYYLTACAIFQDETLFLKEWLEYHKLIGIEHFVLYNNLSTDNYRAILEPYIKEGTVELFDWNVITNNQRDYLDLLQKPAYMKALEYLKDKTTWIAFIDIDEYIVPMQHPDLPSLLREFESYGGLAINWQMFGTSRIDNLPENGLIIEHLTWKARSSRSLNQFIKLIVQPHAVAYIHDPHDFEMNPGSIIVNSHHKPLPPRARGQTIVDDIVCINHYWFGTMEWFINHKIPRREKWGLAFPKENLIPLINAYNEIEDKRIHRFLPQLKQAFSND